MTSRSEIAALKHDIAKALETNADLLREIAELEAKVAGLEKLLERARKIISDMSPGHYIHEEISAALAPTPATAEGCSHEYEGRYDKPDDGVRLMQWYCRKCGVNRIRAEHLTRPATPAQEV